MHLAISKSTKFTLLLLSMMTMMSNVAIVTTLPLLTKAYEATEHIEFLARLMITLPSLAIAILAPLLGGLIYRFGKKRSALIALFLFSFFGSAGLFLGGIYELLASRFLFGVAIAVLMIVSTSLVGDYFAPEERHRFMGQQGAFMALGGIFFIIGGGVLADINWRYPFGIYLVGLVIAYFASRYLIDVGHTPRDGDDGAEQKMGFIYLLGFLLMVIFYILPTQIPFLIINHFHASSLLAGAIIATAFLSNALGAITFGKLKKRYTFATIYMIGMGIVAVGFILIGNVSNVYLFFFTSPIMGFGGGVLMTATTAWMLSLTNHHNRVRSTSRLTSALFLGQFASPFITYPLVQYFRLDHFFVIMGSGILGVLAILFGVWIFKRG